MSRRHAMHIFQVNHILIPFAAVEYWFGICICLVEYVEKAIYLLRLKKLDVYFVEGACGEKSFLIYICLFQYNIYCDLREVLRVRSLKETLGPILCISF